MKSVGYLFLCVLFIQVINASEQPHDPFHGLTLDQEVKEQYLRPLRVLFNKMYPAQEKSDFVERVKAIADTNHSLRCTQTHLAQAYLVLKYNKKKNKVLSIGMISSMEQLYQVLGPNYKGVLQSDHIVMNHFKDEYLQDGEMIDMGALLLGTNDVKIMMKVAQQDIKNDFIDMTQRAYKGILNE